MIRKQRVLPGQGTSVRSLSQGSQEIKPLPSVPRVVLEMLPEPP